MAEIRQLELCDSPSTEVLESTIRKKYGMFFSYLRASLALNYLFFMRLPRRVWQYVLVHTYFKLLYAMATVSHCHKRPVQPLDGEPESEHCFRLPDSSTARQGDRRITAAYAERNERQACTHNGACRSFAGISASFCA